jgi:hypothetical protein
MTHSGHLRKLRATLDDPVTYHLPLDAEEIPLNPLIGRPLTLAFEGEIHCIACGRKTRKSFNQGYCYPCFRSLAQCDICIVSPEKCHHAAGTCREPEWAEGHCLQPHVVYLSNTAGVKVGITRETQIPTRWIDQGARQALPVARLRTRHDAGRLEVAFKAHVSDRTNWRAMLKDDYQAADLGQLAAGLRRQVEAELDDDLAARIEWLEGRAEVLDIDYPAEGFPQKVVSLNLDKTPQVGGRLQAIKGQYLIFDSGVINLRKYAGYRVRLSLE